MTTVVDWDAALQYVDGDLELRNELARLFVEQIPALVAKMYQGIREGDGSALSLCAHSVRGSAGTLGAVAVCGTALALERLGEDGTLGEAAALMPLIEAQLAELAAVLMQNSVT